MSGYNLLLAPLECPRCGYSGEVEIEFRFGLEDYRRYRLGDILDWGDGKGLRFPSQRPPGGNYTGDGYVECPNCKKDYWVTITVEADRIISAVVNPDKPGYIT